MKSKLSKTSKTVATKKAKTGRTKGAKSRTSSKRRTSQTSYWIQACLSNLKGTFLTATDESSNVSGDLTPKSTCGFYLHATTPSGKEVSRHIRIGPEGLAYRGPSVEGYQTIGWYELETLIANQYKAHL